MTVEDLQAQIRSYKENNLKIREVVMDFIRNNYQGRTVPLSEWATLETTLIRLTNVQ